MHFLASLADRFGPVLVLGVVMVLGLRGRQKREDVNKGQMPATWSVERSLLETRR